MSEQEKTRDRQWLQNNVLSTLIAACYVFAWTAATLHLVSMGLPGWVGAALLGLMFLIPLAVATLTGGFDT